MAAHEIKVIKSGKLLTVEEGDSIVTSANNQGMDLPFSCMQGMCTTCMAKLVEGEIEYIEAPDKDALNAEDISNNMILMCVATPKTSLIIDESEK